MQLISRLDTGVKAPLTKPSEKEEGTEKTDSGFHIQVPKSLQEQQKKSMDLPLVALAVWMLTKCSDRVTQLATLHCWTAGRTDLTTLWPETC